MLLETPECSKNEKNVLGTKRIFLEHFMSTPLFRYPPQCSSDSWGFSSNEEDDTELNQKPAEINQNPSKSIKTKSMKSSQNPLRP